MEKKYFIRLSQKKRDTLADIRKRLKGSSQKVRIATTVLSGLEWYVGRNGPHARWRARLTLTTCQYRIDGPLLCNHLIHVDAAGRPLARKHAVFKNHPVTLELIEVTSELNWQNDPQLLSRVDKLCETLAQMKLEREQNIASGKTHPEADQQDWFVDISVPVRQAAAETIRESEM